MICGTEQSGYFLDIGIPADYSRAVEKPRLLHHPCDLLEIVQMAEGFETLLLDRDGVINRLHPGDYIKEPGEFEASFSAAWSKGFTSQDVFWVHPDQVSKTPEAGEFLAKGSFVIRGHRNYIRGARVKLAVGIVDYEGKRIMAGPIEALEAHCENYVVLKPGFTKKEAIAKKIIGKINEDDLLSLDDIIRVLPSGKCDIDEEYHQRKKYEKKYEND